MHKIYYQTNEYMKNCECIGLLLKEMESAKCGVDNLKFTYQNDPNIVSQIDILLLKISTIIKDFSQKLMFFQSFIQNDQYMQYNTIPQEIPNVKEMLSSSFSNGGNVGSFGTGNGGTVVGSFNQRTTEAFDENKYTELQSVKVEGDEYDEKEDILDNLQEMY
jgi:hypothetical protein